MKHGSLVSFFCFWRLFCQAAFLPNGILSEAYKYKLDYVQRVTINQQANCPQSLRLIMKAFYNDDVDKTWLSLGSEQHVPVRRLKGLCVRILLRIRECLRVFICEWELIFGSFKFTSSWPSPTETSLELIPRTLPSTV